MMGAVWMRLRAEGRARWRAWLGLALLVGLASGVSIAAAAGARRSETAYPRFVEEYDGADIVFGQTADPRGIDAVSAEIVALSQVAGWARSRFVSFLATLPDGRVASYPGIIALVGLGDDTTRGAIDRFKVLDGRKADQSRPDEAVIPFTTVEKLGLKVGDVIRVHVTDFAVEPSRRSASPPSRGPSCRPCSRAVTQPPTTRWRSRPRRCVRPGWPSAIGRPSQAPPRRAQAKRDARSRSGSSAASCSGRKTPIPTTALRSPRPARIGCEALRDSRTSSSGYRGEKTRTPPCLRSSKKPAVTRRCPNSQPASKTSLG